MLRNELKYSYKDVSIVPAILSSVQSRSECNPYYDGKMLPLFASPMDTVVGIGNYDLWEQKGITAILPRTVPLDERIKFIEEGKWVALSLGEFKELFSENEKTQTKTPHILIDVANGHMADIYILIKEAKKVYPGMIVMAGNIANPETYRIAATAGVDFVRCGIGAGRGCVTSSNTSVHYPMASLISEIHEIKKELIENGQVDHLPAIVADGGVRGYSDVIKALALGADYVMIGSVFAKMLESAAPGQVIIKDKNYDLMKFDEILYEGGKFQVKEENGSLVPATIVKTFYGMASKKGQLAMNGKKTHTSEGIETTLNVEYTMQAWVENFTDYLRSAMSYVGVRDLQCFKEQTDLVINSQLTVQGINK